MKQGIYSISKTLNFEASQHLKLFKYLPSNGWIDRLHQITCSDQEKAQKNETFNAKSKSFPDILYNIKA